MTTPIRIQLSRKKGWRMPPDTVKVDRSTRWGNPAIVGQDGTTGDCVILYLLLANGALCISHPGLADRQRKAHKVLMAEAKAHWPTLRGKNIACWCRLDKPCHGDILLDISNRRRRDGNTFDIDAYLVRYGLRYKDGKVQPANT